MPCVSIIMNCYNGEQYLQQAVDSIMAQTYADWELIFYDNASTDSSAQIVHQYDDSRIVYYRRAETVPLGQARNHALSMASGELIAFLDVDDYWMPDKLMNQCRLFEEHPETSLVFGDVRILYVQEGQERQLFPMMMGKSRPPRGEIFPFLLHKYVINMGSAVIRRTKLVELDEWFDETMVYSPDFDLFMRLAVDSRIDYTDDIVMVYRVHQKSLSHSVVQSTKYLEPLRTLEKISQAYPELSARLKKDFQSCVIRTVATQLWKQGQARKAREMALDAIGTREGFSLFMLSFFSFSRVESIADRLLWFRRKRAQK